MLKTGPNEPPTRRYARRQMIRVSKIPLLSKLEPFAKRQNRIGFSKFQMPYGLFFDVVHKIAIEIGFLELSFLVTFNRISGFWPRKKIPDMKFVGPDLPFTNMPSVRFQMRPLPTVPEGLSGGIIIGVSFTAKRRQAAPDSDGKPRGPGATIHKLSGPFSWGYGLTIHKFLWPLELDIWTPSPQIEWPTSCLDG